MTKCLPYVLLAAALAIPTTVRAEPLALPLSVYIAAATADLATTHAVLHYQGVGERNPLGAWLEDSPTGLVTYSALLDAATVMVLHRLWGRRHPTWERVVLYGAAAVRTACAIDNARYLRQLQREGHPRTP